MSAETTQRRFPCLLENPVRSFSTFFCTTKGERRHKVQEDTDAFITKTIRQACREICTEYTQQTVTRALPAINGAKSDDVFVTAGPSPIKKHQLYTLLLQDDYLMQSPCVSLADCLYSITWSSSGRNDTQCLQHNCTDSQCKYVATDVIELSVLCSLELQES